MRRERPSLKSVALKTRKTRMPSAKLSILYFVLSAVFAVAAALATPCLLVQRAQQAHAAALDNSPFWIDARIALAR